MICTNFEKFEILCSMAKLADLRSNLSKEERDEYEKFRSDPKKIAEDDIAIVEVKSGTETSESKGA